jgi:hypothetical protein
MIVVRMLAGARSFEIELLQIISNVGIFHGNIVLGV